MDATGPAAYTTNRSDPRLRGSSLTVAAISLALVHPLASSLSLGDVAVLARTCQSLKGPSERALVRSVSVIPRARSVGEEAGEVEEVEVVSLCSASAVDSFTNFVERWAVKDGGNPSEETVEVSQGGGEVTADKLSTSPRPQSSDDTPTLRPRQLALHLYQLSSSTSLLKILHHCASTLTHLRITYAEHLLAHDKRIYAALASLSRLTSLAIHCVGPRSCAFIKALKARLEHVEVEFADDWVHSVLSAPLSQPAVPHLFNGGLPTPIPTPAASPAAPEDVVVLPDPISLLAHSMPTLRTLRASNAIIVTVADKLRYPRVKTLALRLAGVPTVTPLVHAFPALAELYVYTPFDGCGLRAPSLPESEEEEKEKKLKEKKGEDWEGEEAGKRRLRAPMPSIHATRSANRTSQLYSSFPPLVRVRGFVPGLYALGLTCNVRHVEIGRLAPPSEGTEEARAVREVLADAKPTSVTIGLGRGWWAEGHMTVVERESGKEKEGGKRRRKSGEKEEQRKKAKVKEESGACGTRQRRKEKETARDALTSIFGGSMADDEVWAGVTDLVLRVEEPGNWKHVTRDILAMLLPLTNTLATFVLHWDRTSVPFDRIPYDDGYEDPDGDVPMYSDDHPLNDRTSLSRSRVEAFARYAGEQHPALRYALIKILHDDPGRPAALTPKASLWSAPPPPTAPQLAAPLCESRFFRIERSQGWLCLDTLPAGVAERVMTAEGLSFVDRVRYY
ncbi:hypothetical protein V8D89_009368 [Ganoderma adspersum]